MHLTLTQFVSRSRHLLGGILAFLAGGSLAHADLNQNASFLHGGSNIYWSSDLGPDWGQSIEPDYGINGTTTPQRPENYDFAGQSVTTSVNRFGVSSTMTVDPGANGPAEGNISHVRIQNTVPAGGFYGLGAYCQVNNAIWFDGANGAPSTVYFAYAWKIDNGVGLAGPGENGPSMDSDIRFASAFSFGTSTADATGTGYGSGYLGRGDGRNAFDGVGVFNVGIEFGLFNPAGSSSPGGTSTLDFWYTFSNAPITNFNPLPATGTSPVPESATTAALLGCAVLGLAGWQRRFRQAACLAG